MIKVALDFDNVLVDTTGSVLRQISKQTGNCYYHNEVSQYDMESIVNLSSKELWDCFLKSWDCYTELKPLDLHSDYYVKKMVDNNEINVSIISAAGREIISEWLEYWKFPKLDIIYSGPGKDKINYDFDILVDDKPSHVMNLPFHKGVLFDRPWNKTFEYLNRVYNFKELYQYILYRLDDE